MIKETIFH